MGMDGIFLEVVANWLPLVVFLAVWIAIGRWQVSKMKSSTELMKNFVEEQKNILSELQAIKAELKNR